MPALQVMGHALISEHSILMEVSIVAWKAHVAPTKVTTVPRLELIAAVVAARNKCHA